MTQSNNKTRKTKKTKNFGHPSVASSEPSPSKIFTFDGSQDNGSNLNEMPSVSRLMDRKKLFREPPPAPPKKSPSPSKQEESDPPPQQLERHEKTATLPASSFFENPPSSGNTPPPFQLGPGSSAAGGEAARVQPAQRRGAQNQVSPLYFWTNDQLRGTADPMGPAIVEFLRKGAVTVLFLARDPHPLPGGATGFLAKAFSGDKGKSQIWRGLRWNSNILPPDLWKFLLQQGSIEFPPPATQTHESSARNILRTSFGAQKNEWLILTRVGPEIQIRGLIAIIARQSIHGPIRSALESLWRKYTPQT